jgi:hypothetical protein
VSNSTARRRPPPCSARRLRGACAPCPSPRTYWVVIGARASGDPAAGAIGSAARRRQDASVASSARPCARTALLFGGLAHLHPGEQRAGDEQRRVHPTAIPTNSASARSCSVVAPEHLRADEQQRPDRQDRGDRRVDRAVQHLVHRRVDEFLVGAAPGSPSAIAFSLTRSKTTTVSYSEYPRMVSSAMTVAGDTLKPTSAYTPTVIARSWTSATPRRSPS